MSMRLSKFEQFPFHMECPPKKQKPENHRKSMKKELLMYKESLACKKCVENYCDIFFHIRSYSDFVKDFVDLISTFFFVEISAQTVFFLSCSMVLYRNKKKS